VTSPQSKIVVGVDGSPSSQQALRWAVEQVRLTGGDVDAVIAWHMPASYGWETETVLTDIDWAGAARKTLETAVREALDPADKGRVHEHVVEGHPSEVLVDRARDADLVVVGSRGRGAFAGMLLGSVGLHVLTHAPCPVLVVHGDRPSPSTTATGDAAASAR
jgi:nucleotide-binding universal stress UspA family protein